jgi:diguanylate cyclase (GGDEF)-like protein
MSILVVEDNQESAVLLQRILESSGHPKVHVVHSAPDAYEFLGVGTGRVNHPDINLILLDILLPDVDGIDACRHILGDENFRNIPIITVTATSSEQYLAKAFDAGAVDFISKPFRNEELLARVRSAMRLKHEIDRRAARERELERANAELFKLSSLDGLTGVGNRRRFDEILDKEWRRALRNHNPLAMVMVDIDFFKAYNDRLGHLAGDDCLKEVARALSGALRRPGDFVTRYGGEEFAVILPETALAGALKVAEEMRRSVEALAILHPGSKAARVVTISAGAAFVQPEMGKSACMENLIALADGALLDAKKRGRNQVVSMG